MEQLLESVLKDDNNVSKSDFLKIFYSCLEDESFLDEFRAYMKQYLFHSLKHSKLKSITEPTQAIKCHSVSPKIQSLNLLIADYLLRQDFLYTLSVFSSEAPNLKNLTTFSRYINRLAEQGTSNAHQSITNSNVPKLMSKDVKDILECLGLSPHCEESVAARQQYMQCDEGDPLIVCLLSSLVSTLRNISRCPKCKSSYNPVQDDLPPCQPGDTPLSTYKLCPWQKELCAMLNRHNLEDNDVILIMQNVSELINKEVEQSENKVTTQLAEREAQLQQYEEMIGDNLQEAESSLLVQKQGIEKELVRKQRDLQDLAQSLSRKKANIGEAVTILQKQKNLLLQKESELNAKLSVQTSHLESKATQLEEKEKQIQAKEKELNERLDKLAFQREDFYAEILKLCANKNNHLEEKNLNVKYVSTVTGKQIGTTGYAAGSAKELERTYVNGERKNVNGRLDNMFGYDNRPSQISRTGRNGGTLNTINESNDRNMFEVTNDKNRCRVETDSRHIERNHRQVEGIAGNVERTHGKLEGNVRSDDRYAGRSMLEANSEIVVPEEMVLLLETVKTQSEALSKLLQRPATDSGKSDNALNSEEPSSNRLIHVCNDGQVNQPSPQLKRSDGKVNDDNTICDRCGSEVILKFHINDSKQNISRSDQTVKNKNSRQLDNVCLGEKNNQCNRENEIQQSTRCEEMNALQNQMSDLMNRFETLSTNQKQENSSTNQKQENYSTNQRRALNREPRKDTEHSIPEPEPFSLHKTQILGKDRDWRVSNPQPQDLEDPVDLSCQTLARLESQMNALDESWDKYRRDRVRKESKLNSGETMDLSSLNNLLSAHRIGFSSNLNNGFPSEPTRFNTGPKQSDCPTYQSNMIFQPELLEQTSSYRLPLLNPTSNQPTQPYQNITNYHLTPPYQNVRNERQSHPKPPYFSSNAPFWQSYLKTHAFPPKKIKCWQDHFQDFANHVDHGGESMGGDKNGEDMGTDKNERQIYHNGDIGNSSDGRKITNVKHYEAEMNRNRNEDSAERHETSENMGQSNSYRTAGRMHDTTEQESIRRTETITSQMKQMNSPRNNKHSKVYKLEVGRTDQIKDQENTEMEQMEVKYGEQINRIEPDKFNANNLDTSQGVGQTEDRFHRTKDEGVDRTEYAFVEGNDDKIGELNNSNSNNTEDTLAGVKNADLKQSEEMNTCLLKQTEEPNVNQIVEYNPRGSLLLQIQDSDESIS